MSDNVKRISFGAFQADDNLHRYTVPNAQTGEPLGRLVLKGFNQPVLDRYREILNGNGRTRGDKPKARDYLFRKTYSGFEFAEEGCEFDLGQGQTEIDFFLQGCAMVVDAALIQHLAEVFPDIDSKK